MNLDSSIRMNDRVFLRIADIRCAKCKESTDEIYFVSLNGICRLCYEAIPK
jgi:formylmethanofuran dehydrogenase subunit E